MVKLVTVRRVREYGTRERKDALEMGNATLYLIATILLLLAASLQLPVYRHVTHLSHTIAMIALLIIFAVNLHDLYATLTAINFQMELLKVDKQLALVEFCVPFLYALGALILFVTYIFLYMGASWARCVGWLVTGVALWELTTVLQSFQVYERTPLQLQTLQKSVLVSLLVGTTLLLLSTVVGIQTWPKEAVAVAQVVAVSFAVGACTLFVVAATMNIIRVIQLKRSEEIGNLAEPLRGGAEERMYGRNVSSSLPSDETEAFFQSSDVVEVGEVSPTTVIAPERLY